MKSLKINVIGARDVRGVGISNLIRRYVDDSYSESSYDFFDCKIKKLKLKVESKLLTDGSKYWQEDGYEKITLTIWNMIDETREMDVPLYKRSNAFIVMFDLTNADSLGESLKKECEKAKNWSPDANFFLVGSKCDLQQERWVVSEDAARKWANDNGIKYFGIVSAKNGTKVDELFQTVVNECLPPCSSSSSTHRPKATFSNLDKFLIIISFLVVPLIFTIPYFIYRFYHKKQEESNGHVETRSSGHQSSDLHYKCHRLEQRPTYDRKPVVRLHPCQTKQDHAEDAGQVLTSRR